MRTRTSSIPSARRPGKRVPRRRLTLMAAAMALAMSALATAQAAATSAGPAAPAADASTTTVVNAPVAYRETVADLDATIRFYHGVLGLELASRPSRWSTDPTQSALSGTRVRSRTVDIAVPNETFVLRFTQYRGVHQTPQQAGPADPGQMQLTLSVKNAQAAYAALRAAHTPTLREGGTIPDGTGTGTITTWVRDPDGMPVEVVQRSGPDDWFTVDPPVVTDGPGMRYVIRGQIDFVAKSDTASLRFYRDLLGFDIDPGFSWLVGPYEHPVMADFLADMFGITHGSTWAAATGNCAPEVRCEFFEYDDPARTDFRPARTDPGAPSYEISTTDLPRLVARLKAAGVTIVTPHGHASAALGTQSILVRDFSGLLVQIDQAGSPRG